MKIVVIEDEAQFVLLFREWAEEEGHNFNCFDNAMDANKVPADLYIIDMSAIGGLYNVHTCWSPIANLIANHPGADIAIMTAWPKDMIQEVIDRVKEEMGREPIYIQNGANCWDQLDNICRR